MTERYLYTESTGIMDGKLLICTLGVAFAMFALVWDYLNPFPASRPILILCVLSYFVMMGVLTLYTMYTEMGIFLVCCEKDKAGIDPDNVWMISSYIKRYDDIYNLTFSYFDGTTNQKRETTIKKSVANFFDENGVLCHDLFEPEIKKLRDGLSSGKKEK
ncbi:signal peptidase complex subunit 2-like [Tubulanus polymorphus]|uniref:signal peptidase complex subunit 2-like n=1 Tax=Tubulanus polymorphus TaxID=672921 RepID=UPI003DA373A7